jgi:hypothetical protein
MAIKLASDIFFFYEKCASSSFLGRDAAYHITSASTFILSSI